MRFYHVKMKIDRKFVGSSLVELPSKFRNKVFGELRFDKSKNKADVKYPLISKFKVAVLSFSISVVKIKISSLQDVNQRLIWFCC